MFNDSSWFPILTCSVQTKTFYYYYFSYQLCKLNLGSKPQIMFFLARFPSILKLQSDCRILVFFWWCPSQKRIQSTLTEYWLHSPGRSSENVFLLVKYADMTLTKHKCKISSVIRCLFYTVIFHTTTAFYIFKRW